MTYLPPANILLVDDMPANLIALAAILEPLKQNLVKAASGEEALRHLLDREFALILMDVQMPQMDGFETVKLIRSRPADRDIPIIFITAIDVSLNHIIKAYHIGAVDYLIKPIIPEVLLSKVKVFLELYNNQVQLKRYIKELAFANEVLKDEILERQQTESLLLEKQQYISRINHQHQLILNAAGDGIYGIDSDGNTTFLNPAAVRILGYTIEEIFGLPEHAILHRRKTEECPICQSFQKGKVYKANNEIFWRKDGSCFPVEYISTPIQEKGKILGAVIIFKDITERLKIDQIKNEFISIVSHELRTPLTSIRGSLGLLSTGIYAANPEKTKRMLEIALTDTERLVRLVNDILDLERLTSHKSIPAKQWCNVATLIEQALENIKILAEANKISLCISQISITVLVDPNWIVQTLINLLSNAIKFSPYESKIMINVKLIEKEKFTNLEKNLSRESDISTESKYQLKETLNSYIIFQIKDEGRGIPADQLESIFGRFHQVEVSDSRQKGGTGLGLAICRSIVEQHGGQIWAESILGKGSSFYFTIPMHEEK